MMERNRTASNRSQVPRALTAAWCSLGLLIACDQSHEPSLAPEPDQTERIRTVRVLINHDPERVRFRSDGPLFIVEEHGASRATFPAGRWLDVRATPEGRVRILGEETSQVDLILTPQPRRDIYVLFGETDEEPAPDPRAYYGRMRVDFDEDQGLRVINLVPLERYVECVVAAEVWPTFETEALRAQAIAARTYVLFQMHRRRSASYDVAATQGDQVYRGIRRDATARRAAEATRDTRGMVCTWRRDGRYHIFPTYYSSACGGLSQSAAIFGKADDIEPLAGGIPCHYCRIAPGDSYRWGPTELPAKEALSRLVSRFPRLAALERLIDIVPSEVTGYGRLVRVDLVGSSGKTVPMLAERFRMAVGPDIMRSTDCEIRLEAGTVTFSRGRGFGHGLGLCQWGMQGQALAGKRAEEILRYYYPGSTVRRFEELNDRL